MPSGLILNDGKISSWREWATPQTTNIGDDRRSPGIKILPLPSANGFLGGRMSA